VGVDEALRKVKDKVDAVQSSPDFPKDLPADPNIFELNIAELQPIMNINISGEFTADQLEDYAKYLEEQIEDIPSIASVDVRGIDDKEVRIAVDLQKMEDLDNQLQRHCRRDQVRKHVGFRRRPACRRLPPQHSRAGRV